VLGVGVVAGIVGRGVDVGLRDLDIDEGVSLTNVRAYPLLALVHGAGMVLYAIAAASFVRSSRRTDDGVLGYLSAGACLAAFARVHYVLFPSLYTSLVYSGDVLRFAAYLAFGAAAAREIRNYWGSVSAAAVAAERRRAARELHDGLVQELAFIRSRVVDFALSSPESRPLADLAASAERALAESRQLLVILTGQDEQFGRFDAHLRRAADEVARRLGVHVDVIAAVSPTVCAETAHSLARVVREAVTNAAVHGHATTVAVEITEARDHVVVSILDDGIGFDPGDVRPGGFGMTSMRERVAGLGGELSVESSPGAGTRVRVAIPRS
jgi:signal transduction histidine kinase